MINLHVGCASTELKFDQFPIHMDKGIERLDYKQGVVCGKLLVRRAAFGLVGEFEGVGLD